MWMILRWFMPSWWSYLFKTDKYSGDGKGYARFSRAKCRMKGHPYGVVWVNVNGWEPSMECKNCGDDLG